MVENKKNDYDILFKLFAAATTLISCIRVLLINSHSDGYFYSNDVAQITLETHQVVQIGVAAILFTITLLIIADVMKNK